MSCNLFAYGEFKNVYIAKAIKGESLKELLNTRFKISNFQLYSKNYYKINELNNKHIKNFKSLRKGESIFIVAPLDLKLKLPTIKMYVRYPVKKQTKINRKELLTKKEKKEIDYILKIDQRPFHYLKEKLKEKSKFDYSFFYTFSQGDITDQIFGATSPIKATLNSKLTFGAMMLFKQSDDISLSASLYYSILNPVNTIDQTEIPNSAEIGFNFYRNQVLRNSFGLYYGLDYEKSPIYNNYDLFLNGQTLKLIDQNMVLATVGAFQRVRFLSRNFYVKGGISVSLWNKKLLADTYDDYQYKSVRYLLYINTTIFNNVLVHALYKHHDLYGASNIKINRFGFGVGIKF